MRSGGTPVTGHGDTANDGRWRPRGRMGSGTHSPPNRSTAPRVGEAET